MGLKGDRSKYEVELTFRMNETATRGGGLFYLTGGSGAAMDSSSAVVTYDGNQLGGSGLVTVAGVLAGDVVNLDLSRQHINWHKDEVQVGGKVPVVRRGWVVTNMISSGTPSVGAAAYVDLQATTSGQNLTPVAHDPGGVAARPYIGEWMSSLDEDSYAKLYVNLPGNSPQL